MTEADLQYGYGGVDMNEPLMEIGEVRTSLSDCTQICQRTDSFVISVSPSNCYKRWVDPSQSGI